MSEDPIPSWSNPHDDSPPSSRTLLRAIDAIRWYAVNGELSRATDNLDALEAVAGDEGPLSMSRVAECRAGIQAQQWDWAGALTSLEWSRDLQVRLNSKFAAEFTASRVLWLMGDREGSLARVDALLERGPTGRLERSVALCLGYRTEAVDGPDDGELMWQGLFENHFTDWPIIGEIGFALARLQAQRGDDAASRSTLQRLSKAPGLPRVETACTHMLLRSQSPQLRTNSMLDPVARGNAITEHLASAANAKDQMRHLFRLHVRIADLGRFDDAARITLDLLAEPSEHRMRGIKADPLTGYDPHELAVWYAIRAGDPALVLETAHQVVDRLRAHNRPRRALQLVDRIAEHGPLSDRDQTALHQHAQDSGRSLR